MQNNFQKIRRLKWIRTAVMSSLVGASVALAVVGVLLNVFLRVEIAFPVWGYLGVALGCLAVFGGITLLVGLPTQKRLAKKLDRKYRLQERTQTLLEFEKDESDIAGLQRTDAQERLGKLPVKAFSLKELIVGIVSGVLALALFISGLFVPVKDNGGGGGKPPYRPPTHFGVSEYQKVALGNLISTFMQSGAEQRVLDFTKAELDGLMQDLDEMDTREKLYEGVALVIVAVDSMVESVSTYKKIYLPLRASEEVVVQDFAKAVGNMQVVNAFKTFRLHFENTEKDKAVSKSALNGFVTATREKFQLVDVATTDALYRQVSAFLDETQALLGDYDSYSYDYMKDQVAGVLNKHGAEMDKLLAQQDTNRKAVNVCIEGLIEIFSLPTEYTPKWGGEALMGLEEETTDENPSGGNGPVEEGLKYPSKEKIYDYYTKQLGEYGVFFDGESYNYKGSMNNDVGSIEEMPSEIVDIVNAYILLLSAKDN